MKKSCTQPQFFIRPICAAVLLACAMQSVQANPTGASVVNGQASFATNGNTLTVTNTPGTIINWKSFSIGVNETTYFQQQSATSTVLNRDLSGNPSYILGTLRSNGVVFIANASGTIFGPGATIDVAGLVATTLNISNADFLAGRYRFTEIPGAGNISNAGEITAKNGGQIYLIAPNVENSGVITAPNGEILLVAGHSVELVDTANPNLRVNITAPAGEATNVGKLVASSGSLGLFGTVVRNSGTVSADSATMQGGKIVFKASQRSEIGGTVSANGVTGGTIEALGNQVGIMDGARVSANGAQGGGTVLVGGDYQGKNPDVPNAQITYVAPDASISADATDNGNGGKVIVWADDTTRAYGSISARGGANGGDGGFVEISGKRYLEAGAEVDTRAPYGRSGTLLMDPTDITIDGSNSPPSSGSFTAGVFDGGANTSSIMGWGYINGLLSGGNVVIQTSSGGAGTGDITFSQSGVSAGGINSLSFLAENNIVVNAPITYTSSGSLTMVSGWNPASGYVTPTAIHATNAGNMSINANITSAADLKLRVKGNLNVTNASVTTASGKAMSVEVGGILNVTAAIYQAMLKSGGTQTINFVGAGAHQMNLLGGTIANGAGAGVFASVESGGAQQILNSGGGTLAISLNGGDVLTAGLSAIDHGVTICATCATHNSATIKSGGTQTINATTLALTGGSGGNGNSAHIESAGASNITVTGAVTLSGGTSGGIYVAGLGDFKGIIGNEASIDSDTTLTFNAGSISMASGTATYGGAFIGAPTVNVTTAGNITMTGGAGSSGGALDLSNPYPAGYIWYNPVAIGNDASNASVTLNVGGNLTLTGGAVGATGGSQAMIGSLGSANVIINGQGGITLNGANQFADRIGSWNGSGGSVTLKSGLGGTGIMDLGKGLIGTGATGSVTLIADGTGAAITQNAAGRIGAASLNASTVTPIGSINLPGSNKVASVVAATYGNFLYNSNMSFLASSIASTNGTVMLASSAGDVSLGTVTAGGSATVNAYGAIYETNGVGVADITANSVSLSSQYGGTASGLAISADVSLVGAAAKTVSASVSGTASYGGIRIKNAGVNEPTSVSLTDASTTAGYAGVRYSTGNNVSTSAGAYNLSSQNGGVSLYSDGTVTLTNLATFLPGQSNAAYKFIDIQGKAGLTVSSPGSTVADMFLGTAGSMSLSGSVGANNLGLYAAGPLSASGATIGATYDVGMWSDSGISLTNTTVAASNGSAYLGSAALVFDANGGKSYSSGGSITLSGSNVSAGLDVYGYTGGDIRLNNGSSVQAGNNVYLTLAGAASMLYLNELATMSPASYILAGAPGATYLDFQARSGDGVVIDEVGTLNTSVGGSGFFRGNTSVPAAAAAGLAVNYGVASTVVTNLVSEIAQTPVDVVPITTSDIVDLIGTGATSSTTTEEEKQQAETVVLTNGTTPVTGSTAVASLPVCK